MLCGLYWFCGIFCVGFLVLCRFSLRQAVNSCGLVECMLWFYACFVRMLCHFYVGFGRIYRVFGVSVDLMCVLCTS